MVKEMGAFSKTKIKTKAQKLTPEIRIAAGRLRMHELTSILYFFKMDCRPPKRGFFYLLMACCYVAILVLIVVDYELVYNGTRGGVWTFGAGGGRWKLLSLNLAFCRHP